MRTIKPTWGNLRSLLTKFGMSLLNWLGKRVMRHHVNLISKVASYFLNCLVNEGVNTMIAKMKVSVIAIEKYLAGQPLSDTRPLGAQVSLRSGLPGFLPSYARSAIRSQSLYVLRLVLSLLSVYRGMTGDYGDPSYESISAPKSQGNFRDLHEWFDIFVRKENGIFPPHSIRLFGMRAASISFLPIFTSSPNHGVSY